MAEEKQEAPEKQPDQKNDYVEIPIPKVKTSSINFVLIVLLVIAAFFLGVLYTRVQVLEKNAASSETTARADSPSLTEKEEESGPVNVSVDDDPVLGNANAPVTLIEFSDYECPFCKRYFEETYPQLKKDYVDTGHVKIVYRDLPLSFHDPMATTEAIAANCARAQGGDSVYFRFHDEIFTKTTSNGNGLSKDDLYAISDSLGINTANLKTCLEDISQAEEVKKDINDGNLAGATATPTFFIGKSAANGTITATKLVGAQPYAAFKTIIDEQLK